jgi:very-short-patch-repair endonuclease/predicted transcriptional regulator of viral defense system
MTALDDRLLPVFARQHWLVTTKDVTDAGGSPQQTRDRLQHGRWARVDRGVYRLVGAPTSWQQRVLAPILGAGTDATVVASHYAAAALHGIPGFGRGVPELTATRGYNLRRATARIHSNNDLERSRLVVIDGIPVTDVSRTILDLARTVSDAGLLRAIEWGRRAERTSWSGLIAVLARHARRGRPGIQRLRRVITANAHRGEITDTDFELLLLTLLVEHGLPEPVVHHRVCDGERFVAEVDLAYPNRRIAIEADGGIHLEPHVHEKDLPRQNDLVLVGWTVLRYTWKRYTTRPERIVSEVRAALRPDVRAA